MKINNVLVFLLSNLVIGINYPIAFVNDITLQNTFYSQPLTSFNNPRYISESTVIDNSGIYALNSNISFDPALPNQSCITIATDNVILDLNRKTISQTQGNTQPGTNAITINNGAHNVVIRNGSITDTTQYGIYINDGTDVIHLLNLTIDNAGVAGIFFDGSSTGSGISNVNCSNIQINELFNPSGNPSYGLNAKFCNVIDLSECVISKLITTTGNCYGIKIKNCSAIRCTSCITTENISGAQRTYGFHFIDSNPCLLNNCLSSNNTCTSNDPSALCAGFIFETSQNLICNECAATSNIASYTSIGFLFDACTTAAVINCQSFSNTSLLLDAIGFYANNGLVNGFQGCLSLTNSGFNNGYGYLLNNSLASGIDTSIAQVNIGSNSSYGIALLSTGSSLLNQNKLLGHVSNGFGIFDDAGVATTNLILGNYAIKNSTNYSPGSPTIPVFTGPLTATPSPFENVSL